MNTRQSDGAFQKLVVERYGRSHDQPRINLRIK